MRHLLVSIMLIMGIVGMLDTSLGLSAEKVVKFGLSAPFSGGTATWGVETKR